MIIENFNEKEVKTKQIWYRKDPENYLKVAGHCKNIDTGEYDVVIQFRNLIENKDEEIVIPRSEISERKICKEVARRGGMTISKEMFEKFISDENFALRAPHCNFEMETNIKEVLVGIPMKNYHQKLGYEKIGNNILFRGDRIIGKDSAITSTYKGNLKIGKRGSYDNYINMIRDEIIGNVKLEAIMAMAASATILPFLNICNDTFLYNPIVHIFGNSSTGKTTILKLAISLGGCGEIERGESLFLTFNSTIASLMKKIGDNCGYPIGIDEISMLTEKNVTGMVYSLAEGEEKERLRGSGERLQKRASFETVIFTNGEASLLNRCRQNEGLRYRVFEFGNINWTESPESADRIKSIVRDNYGFVTPLIAKSLIENQDRWLNAYKVHIKQINKNIKDSGKIERIVNVISMFMLGVDILEEVTQLKFNNKGVYDFLYENMIERVFEFENIGRKAIDYLYEFYSTHTQDFKEDSWFNQCHEIDANAWGLVYWLKSKKNVDGKIYDRCLIFTRERLKEILNKGGFEDESVVLTEIKRMGLLLSKDKNRLESVMKLSGIDCKVYKILLPEEGYEDILEND